MAWYAELKRIKWYCINEWDAITWYSNYLFDCRQPRIWRKISLIHADNPQYAGNPAAEDKKKIEEYHRKIQEQLKKELDRSIMHFCMLLNYYR